MDEELITELEMDDGSFVSADTKLNLKKLMLIGRDFDTSEFAKVTIGGNGTAEITIVQMAKAAYVAYRQANMNNYMSWKDFLDHWEFDASLGMKIYTQLIFHQKKSEYQKAFDDASKKIAVKKGKK